MKRAALLVGAKSIPGHRHHVEGRANEDVIFTRTDHPLLDGLFIVADGMGGHPRPQEAAQTAAQAAREFLCLPDRLSAYADLPELLRAAVRHANRHVRGLAGTEENGKRPGTTLTVAAVAHGILHVAHVGDGSVLRARGGEVHLLAGGERDRHGSAPAEYLGRSDDPQIAIARHELAVGDRVLLCTDGLTRYFGSDPAHAAALREILTRPGATPEAVAAQLTAHSRAAEYEDDTSVVVVEVREISQDSDGLVTPWGPERREPRLGKTFGTVLARGLLGAVLLALGFLLGRGTAPPSPVPSPGQPAERNSPGNLATLPGAPMVLVDELNQRLMVLRTASTPPAPPGGAGIRFQGLKLGRDGRLIRAQKFVLDAARGRLTDEAGRSFAVRVDWNSGLILVQRSGTLVVQSKPPGAACFIDGRRVGVTPVREVLPAGQHLVRVVGETWSHESSVEVSDRRTITLALGPGP
ncbi:MAG: protein phosphatase 2C domain-containing protein [Armatimonadetes bacterium]|nr:protein phosphatase 2C domain-containing protein [Armatimonadota bacterium]